MTGKTIAQELANWFAKSLSKLPDDKRKIATKHIKDWSNLSPAERRAKAETYDRDTATIRRIRVEQALRKQAQAEKDPQYSVALSIVWNNTFLEAAHWFGLKSITPREAALLLCQLNPHDATSDPLSITTTETTPDDFKNLLREFDDVAKADTNEQSRTLSQWRDIARDKLLKYHSWIDHYIEAMAASEVATQTSAPKAQEGNDGLTKREKQIRAIEATIKKLGFAPRRIPDGGKKKIMSTCMKDYKSIFGAGSDPFKEAWQTAVDQNRIRMANHEKFSKK
jgi:hypothetical protein